MWVIYGDIVYRIGSTGTPVSEKALLNEDDLPIINEDEKEILTDDE